MQCNVSIQDTDACETRAQIKLSNLRTKKAWRTISVPKSSSTSSAGTMAVPTKTPSLTTLFVSPISCLVGDFTVLPVGHDTLEYTTMSNGRKVSVLTRGLTSSCFPESFHRGSTQSYVDGSGFTVTLENEATTTTKQVVLETFYSPGMCPYGYITVGYGAGVWTTGRNKTRPFLTQRWRP